MRGDKMKDPADEDVKNKAAADAVNRARRLTEFLQSDFWIKDFRPYLEQERLDLAETALWKPGRGAADPGAVALGAAFNGGSVDEIDQIFLKLKHWKSDGENAAEMLSKKGVTL